MIDRVHTLLYPGRFSRFVISNCCDHHRHVIHQLRCSYPAMRSYLVNVPQIRRSAMHKHKAFSWVIPEFCMHEIPANNGAGYRRIWVKHPLRIRIQDQMSGETACTSAIRLLRRGIRHLHSIQVMSNTPIISGYRRHCGVSTSQHQGGVSCGRFLTGWESWQWPKFSVRPQGHPAFFSEF